MSKYVPRLSAPSTSDKNWIKTTYNGYNKCMNIKNGSVIPNCVGYAWGRARELLGKDHNLSTGNAENWYLKNDGYERSQKPRVGSVICWQKGQTKNEKDGAGHVAIVEEVKSDGTIVTSNSAYGGSRFYTKTLKPPYSMGGSYKFQGFIYLPINLDEPTKPVERDEHKDQLKVIATELRVRTSPSTNGEILGASKKDGIYNFYDIKKDEKYTWYKIADNQWVADNGKWLEIYKKVEEKPVEPSKEDTIVEELNQKLKNLQQELDSANLIIKQLNLQIDKLKESLNTNKPVFIYKAKEKCIVQRTLNKGETLQVFSDL